jgi:hypothetical protein
MYVCIHYTYIVLTMYVILIWCIHCTYICLYYAYIVCMYVCIHYTYIVFNVYKYTLHLSTYNVHLYIIYTYM